MARRVLRACEGQAGAGRCCARARQAQTVAERLRSEGARVHEDVTPMPEEEYMLVETAVIVVFAVDNML